MNATIKLLRLDASARREGSVSRQLADKLLETLRTEYGDIDLVTRDLALEPLPFVDSAWIEARHTPEQEQRPAHRDAMRFSDELVAELKSADVVVIATPIYNFSVPASLKAWIDLIARPRVTFRYTPNGPVGLLEGKRAYVVIASGGTPIGGGLDFASGYLRHMLGFIGITDVTIVGADGTMVDADGALTRAHAQIAAAAGDEPGEPRLARRV
jgi:FMN-dependent NADH-azoreductase